MKYKSYSHIGKRNNNEDSLACGLKTFILCDGVGGRNMGEIASNEIAQYLLKSIDGIFQEINEAELQIYISKAQDSLNNYISIHQDKEGMATTLAMFVIGKHNAFIAHIGDSRVYYIKPNKGEYWVTTDHSLVAELVEANIVTPENAIDHPMKNNITRAIQANNKGKKVKADITHLSNMENGDLIFICSDGVNESLTDENLINILIEDLPIKKKIASVESICSTYSRDNNTAILIKIENEDVFNSGYNEIDFLPITLETQDDASVVDKAVLNDIPISEVDEDKKVLSKSPLNELDRLPNDTLHSYQNDIDTEQYGSTSSWSGSIFRIVLLLAVFGSGYWLYMTYLNNSNYSIEQLVPQLFQRKSSPKIKNHNNADGSSMDIRDFNAAQEIGTISAFKEYIDDHPNGAYVRKAKKLSILIGRAIKKEEQDWLNAKNTNNYTYYINTYPNGKYFEDAKKANIRKNVQN